MEHFSIRKIYKKLRSDFEKAPWRRLICNSFGAPEWIFILRLAAHGRLYTRDRLAQWGIVLHQICPLCHQHNESISHLFFKCYCC